MTRGLKTRRSSRGERPIPDSELFKGVESPGQVRNLNVNRFEDANGQFKFQEHSSVSSAHKIGPRGVKDSFKFEVPRYAVRDLRAAAGRLKADLAATFLSGVDI